MRGLRRKDRPPGSEDAAHRCGAVDPHPAVPATFSPRGEGKIALASFDGAIPPRVKNGLIPNAPVRVWKKGGNRGYSLSSRWPRSLSKAYQRSGPDTLLGNHPCVASS